MTERLQLKSLTATPGAQIASVTRSTAQASGWIWDIGLQSQARRGLRP